MAVEASAEAAQASVDAQKNAMEDVRSSFTAIRQDIEQAARDKLLRINYLEWIPLNTYMVQRAYRSLTALAGEVSALRGDMGKCQAGIEARASALQARLETAVAWAARQEEEIQELKTKLRQLQAAWAAGK